MSETSLIVLVSEKAAHVESVREALTSAEQQLTLKHVERARTALARIAGGGVAAMLLDITSGTIDERRADFVALRAGAPHIPLLILCDTAEEAAAKQMVKDGAFTYLLRSGWGQDLRRRILAATAKPNDTAVRASRTSRGKGTIITFAGAKGGVGATTVAVNVASVLASHVRVTLAELGPAFGSLCHYFRPARATRGLQNLIPMGVAEIEVAEVESCLWINRAIPGLSVLFATEQATRQSEFGAGQAGALIECLSELSELVVIDLSVTLGQADRAIVERSDIFALIVERDACSVDAAKSKLGALKSAGIILRDAGLVIVNRSPLATPLAIADIESQLGLPTLAVIPPAADLCAAAYRVHTPVVKLDAQSSMATSLANLAKKLVELS